MIGRFDCEALTAGNLKVAYDSILAACRRRWPIGVFLDGNETRALPLNSLDLVRRTASREFFVFSDADTEKKWDDLGPCEENWNLMLHFICDEQVGVNGPYTRVTVVIDELTAEINSFLDELQAAFDASEHAHREAI